jgi:putative protein-disulfide isomerase
MTIGVLHYVCDPLCGWCYGATRVVRAAAAIEALAIEVHCGGLFAGGNARVISPEMRAFIIAADARVTALSGQAYGEAYRSGLLAADDVLLDSVPPTRAVLIAECLAGKALAMLEAIQHAHYFDGRRVAETATLESLAQAVGLSIEAFRGAHETMTTDDVEQHIRDSRRLLQRYGGAGFPTFILEQDGRWQMLNHQPYYGDPAGWSGFLRERLGRAVA